MEEQFGVILQKLQAAAPLLTDLATQAAWFEALSALIGGCVALVIFVIGLRYMTGSVGKWALAKANSYDSDPIGAIATLGFGWLATGIAGLVCMTTLLDPWVYITLARPELWLVKRIVGI